MDSHYKHPKIEISNSIPIINANYMNPNASSNHEFSSTLNKIQELQPQIKITTAESANNFKQLLETNIEGANKYSVQSHLNSLSTLLLITSSYKLKKNICFLTAKKERRNKIPTEPQFLWSKICKLINTDREDFRVLLRQMNGDLYQKIRKYAKSKIISQSMHMKKSKIKKIRRDSLYSKFNKSATEEEHHQQRLNIFKHQMNEIVDQGFKDTAMNQINLKTENVKLK